MKVAASEGGRGRADRSDRRALAETEEQTERLLRIRLLGGFRVTRGDLLLPESGWSRRSAKTLLKLLATHPEHALHRERVLDLLWGNVSPGSALNSFGKALHAARRALEPDLQPRESSSYLHLKDERLLLDLQRVAVDADRFKELADYALEVGSEAAYETALSAYGGELLPEDRYWDWVAERRHVLADLYVRVLAGLAELQDARGLHTQAAARLRSALDQDPTREDIHRRLMRLYAETGARTEAVRQFEICRGVLLREFEMEPAAETEALYRDIVANRIRRRSEPTSKEPAGSGAGSTEGAPFVGRRSALRLLQESLASADRGTGGTLVISGEAGVGKTRLVAEFVSEARRPGVVVVWSGSRYTPTNLPYGPFVVALEACVAGYPPARRQALARAYPVLAHYLPSFGPASAGTRTGEDDLELMLSMARLLSDLAQDQTLVLAISDLDDADPASLGFLSYLAQLAVTRRWLLLGTFRSEGLVRAERLQQMLHAATRERICVHLELEPLSRRESDELVRALLPARVLDDEFLDRIYELSLGNPLFIEELLRDVQRPVSTSGVTRRVRELLDQYATPLDDNTRRVLALAAAAGPEITLGDLQTGAAALEPPLSNASLLAALDWALKSRILEERQSAYAFRHPLVRTALVEELSQHRRLELEAALGGLLE